MLSVGPVTQGKRAENLINYLKSEEFGKLSEEYLRSMSRNERREFKRQEDKAKKFIDNLAPYQLEVVEMLVNVKTNEKLEQFYSIIDRNISALLIDMFPEKSLDEVKAIEEYYSSLIQEDIKKSQSLEKQWKGDSKMADKLMKKYESDVREKVFNLLEQGVLQKQAVEILISKFPMLSKSMLLNGFKKYKEEWEKQSKEDEDPDIKEALESVSDILDGNDNKSIEKIIKESDKYVQQAEKEEHQLKAACDGSSCSIEPQTEIKEENVVKEPKGLKVLSMSLQGENGNYKVCQNGVELSNSNMVLSFENEEQLDSFVQEFKQVFAMVK